MLKNILSLLVIVCFFLTSLGPLPKAHADTVLGLPQPGSMVSVSAAYVPFMLSGLTVHPENPLLIDFIVSTGNSNIQQEQVKGESDRLIKYFLACLTIPEDQQWVNLSPYEKDRIIPAELGQTALGRDMLAQDYILKQLTASLIYPEKNLGKDFWNKVYAQAREMYGTSNVPVNTFNKVWILPDASEVYTHNNTVFVVKSHLKVMLDEDYLSMQKHSVIPTKAGIQNRINLTSQIIRQIILPAIENEVNNGKNFATLRQIYNSMILSVWYKQNLKEVLLNQVYANKKKISGVTLEDKAIKDKIYKQYLEAYKKGVFNYIKEDINQANNQVTPRKYFSGGLAAVTTVNNGTIYDALRARSLGVKFYYLKSLALMMSLASNLTRPKMTVVNAAMILNTKIKLMTQGTEDDRIVLSKAKNYSAGEKLGEMDETKFQAAIQFNKEGIGLRALNFALAKESFPGVGEKSRQARVKFKDKVRLQYAEKMDNLALNPLVKGLTVGQLGRITYDIIYYLIMDDDPHSERDEQIVNSFQKLYDQRLEHDIGLDQLESNPSEWKEVLFRAFVLSGLSSATDDTFVPLKKIATPILGQLEEDESVWGNLVSSDAAFKEFLVEVGQRHGVAISAGDIIPIRLFKLAMKAVGPDFKNIKGRDNFDRWVADIEEQKGKSILIRVDDKEDFVIVQLKIKTLLLAGFKVIVAGVEKPIYNDATAKWLQKRLSSRGDFHKFMIGPTAKLKVISTGTGVPGTDLTKTSLAFNDVLANVPTAVAEGRMNQESLIQDGLVLKPSMMAVSMTGKDGIELTFRYRSSAMISKKVARYLIKPKNMNPVLLLPGGINLNAKNMTMEKEGDKVDIHFNKATISGFEQGNFSGIQFRVLDVIAINMESLLGL